MEIQNLNFFYSEDSLDSEKFESSKKFKKCSLRYTPTRPEEEKSVSLMDLFQDSLEIPRPKSRLIKFSEIQRALPQKSESLRSSNPKNLNGRTPITEMLLKLREKPKPKSSLKNSINIQKQKTVSFCSQIELSPPETVTDSVVFVGIKEIFEDSLEVEPDKSTLATSSNSLICDITKSEKSENSRQNLENDEYEQVHFDDKDSILFEEIRTSLTIKESEFNEYSTIAYCKTCLKETVTEVSFEKVKGDDCVDITEWIICWVLPACMYRKKLLIHRCPCCKDEIYKTEF